MDYQKPRTEYLYSTSLILLIMAFYLFFKLSKYLLLGFHYHWIIFILILITCCSPRGYQKLAAHLNERPKHSFFSYLLRIWSLQVALFLIFIGIATVFTHWVPLEASDSFPAIPIALTTLLEKNGLFPWALVALLAIQLAHIAYVQKKDAYMSRLSKKDPRKLIGVAFNLQAKLATATAISITFTFIILIITSLLLPSKLLLQSGFEVKTLIIVTFTLLMSFTPSAEWISRTLLKVRIPLIFRIFIIIIILSFLIFLLSTAFGKMKQHFVKVPTVIQCVGKKNLSDVWLIFSETWWVAWSPITAIHIACLSRGYTAVTVILVTLTLPAIFMAWISIIPHSLASFNHYTILWSFLALAAGFYLFFELMREKKVPLLILCYLPKKDEYKRRDHYFYFRKCFQVTSICIYVYLPVGMPGMSLVIWILVMPWMLQFLVILFNSIQHILNRYKLR